MNVFDCIQQEKKMKEKEKKIFRLIYILQLAFTEKLALPLGRRYGKQWLPLGRCYGKQWLPLGKCCGVDFRPLFAGECCADG